MWNKKKPEPMRPATVTPAVAPQKPSVLERLKKRRAEKIELRKQLDREIEMLDHDITWIEVNPSSARILEFIGSRFKEEENPQLNARSAMSSL